MAGAGWPGFRVACGGMKPQRKGWGCGPVVACLPGGCEPLGSIKEKKVKGCKDPLNHRCQPSPSGVTVSED